MGCLLATLTDARILCSALVVVECVRLCTMENSPTQ